MEKKKEKKTTEGLRFSCTQENLRAALLFTSSIAVRQGSLPILSNVLIRAEGKALSLLATNLEVAMTYQLRGRVECDGAVTVNAKLLTDIIHLLPKDHLDVWVHDAEVELTCRGSATKVIGMDATEFPLIPPTPDASNTSVDAITLRDAIAQVIFASSGTQRQELSGVLWKFDPTTLTLAATDGYRLAERRVKVPAGGGPTTGFNILVPPRTAQELLRVLGTIPTIDVDATTATVITTENQLLVRIGGLEVFSRLNDTSRYPDYAQIIPTNWTTRVVLARSTLQSAVRAASLFARTGVNDVHLRVLPGPGQLIIRSENSQLGEHQAQLDAEVSGDEVTTILNARYLLEGLAAIPGEQVVLELTGAVAPVVLKPQDAGASDPSIHAYVYIIMPIKQ